MLIICRKLFWNMQRSSWQFLNHFCHLNSDISFNIFFFCVQSKLFFTLLPLSFLRKILLPIPLVLLLWYLIEIHSFVHIMNVNESLANKKQHNFPMKKYFKQKYWQCVWFIIFYNVIKNMPGLQINNYFRKEMSCIKILVTVQCYICQDNDCNEVIYSCMHFMSTINFGM